MTSKGLRRLVCDACPVTADVKLTQAKDELWPQHKCHATHRAAPFNRSTPVPTAPVRDWSTWPDSVAG